MKSEDTRLRTLVVLALLVPVVAIVLGLICIDFPRSKDVMGVVVPIMFFGFCGWFLFMMIKGELNSTDRPFADMKAQEQIHNDEVREAELKRVEELKRWRASRKP